MKIIIVYRHAASDFGPDMNLPLQKKRFFPGQTFHRGTFRWGAWMGFSSALEFLEVSSIRNGFLRFYSQIK